MIKVVPWSAGNSGWGSGWKKGFTDVPPECKKQKGFDFIQCIERYTYAANETILNIDDSVMKVNYYFLGGFTPIAQSLTIEPGVITDKLNSTLNIVLNNRLSFFIEIMDTKCDMMFESPDILPRIFITLKENQSYLDLVYIKVNCKVSK